MWKELPEDDKNVSQVLHKLMPRYMQVYKQRQKKDSERYLREKEEYGKKAPVINFLSESSSDSSSSDDEDSSSSEEEEVIHSVRMSSYDFQQIITKKK